MVERLDGLVPEMMLLALAVVVAVLGLSKASSIRRAVPLLTAGGLLSPLGLLGEERNFLLKVRDSWRLRWPPHSGA